MSYCVNCGQPLRPNANFCVECGAAVAPPVTEAAQPAGRPAGRPAASAASPAPAAPAFSATTGAAPATASAARPAGSFAGIPVLDYVRDVLAALALICSLFMVWYSPNDSGSTIAAARIDVILITVLSLISISIPYLWRTGVFGPAWNYARTQDLRLAANAPYAILVIVYLVIALVTQSATGPALAFGFAGAVLAAQPRRAELAEGDTARDRRWLVVTLAIAGLAAVLTVVQIIELFVARGQYERMAGYAAPLGSYVAGLYAIAVILGIVSAGFLVVAALGILRGSAPWRYIAVGAGIAAAVLGLFALSPEVNLVTTSFVAAGPTLTLVFWIAFGAAASAPSLARLTGSRDAGASAWIDTARAVLVVTAAANIVIVIVAVIELIHLATLSGNYDASSAIVPWTVALILGVLGAVGAIVVRAFSTRDTRQAHLLATADAALSFVLGLVLVIMWSITPLGGISLLAPLLAFAIPLALIAVLWAPPSMRSHYASLPTTSAQGGFSFEGRAEPSAPPRPAETRPDVDANEVDANEVDANDVDLGDVDAGDLDRGDVDAGSLDLDDDVIDDRIDDATTTRDAGTAETLPFEPVSATSAASRQEPGVDLSGGQPAPAPAPVEEPSTESVIAEAADPATPARRLHQIAASVPEARAAIASNPSAYPGLLEWLGELGDPEIDAALRRRG
ncbi:zinc-ribbon domain-containing protein [Microbacterium sp. STN6]|uniref:zinc ribbon domain-containing protein n=1 Tax=Microbacterium sp. STN6 TaxID=2995588 RepID=UPI0022609763|nr:zinc ribbon domain-containing protein [Microbacterium sp. STN6]MCX7520725.1 zinc-ribbon domain-containing protein [Microbacterium sp. STN6]